MSTTQRVRPTSDGILAAAESVFARQRFGDTSLRQLVKEAGVSTTAFYARFDSKEEVLASLIARLLDELRARATTALAELRCPRDAVTIGVATLVSTLENRRPIVALALSEGAAIPSIRDRLAEGYGALVKLIASILVTEDSGKEALAWAFVGALQFQVLRWAVFEEIEIDGLAAILEEVALGLLPAVDTESRR